MQTIIALDQHLFHFINQGLSAGWLDAVMVGVTSLGRIPLIFFPAWLVLFWRGGNKGRLTCWLLIPLLLAGDMIPAHVLKPLFARPRPFLALEGVRLLDSAPHLLGQYGFPSNHATNIFALCTFLALVYREKWLWGFFGASSVTIAFSRIYVGVHYPGDVIVGSLFGMILGFLTYLIYKRIRNLRKLDYT
ncbi:hypothetical protein BVX98_02400 [bacterium F11]|nr:hypothetical protein BVX98_02400 [bacterium F11]